jgi:predicted dehydrogenase
MTKLRGGLFGFGAVAEKAHLPAFAASSDLELAAVAEADAGRRAAAAAALPGAKVYDSAEALLRDSAGLDFVDIATPPFLHAPQALKALEAGLNVLCEKPLALSTDELVRLRVAARAANRCVFTVHNWALAPQWAKVFALAKELGAVKHASLVVSRTRPAAAAVNAGWRADAALSGGGILVDHGWHNLYLLRRLIPSQPKRLSCWLDVSTGTESTARVSLEFAAATAELWLSWSAPSRANLATIVFEKGLLELRDDTIMLARDARSESFVFERKLSEGSAHADWMSALLPEFAAELRDPALRGRNLEEAGFVLQTVQRAYQSARQGRNPVRESFQKLSGQAQFR